MQLSFIHLLLVSHLHLCLAVFPAPKFDHSPGNSYIATIEPTENIHSTGGTLFITSSPTSPAEIDFALTNLPSSGGPFTYHIHTHTVPKDPVTGLRNCTAALTHFDPYVRGESPACDPTVPQSCQLGDLAGKHGAVPAGQRSYAAHYAEHFISTDSHNVNAFVGGNARSVVVHLANKTRIACANIVVRHAVSAVPARNGTLGPGGACNQTTPHSSGSASLPKIMVTASGTAPVVSRPSGLLLAGLPTTTTGPASEEFVGAAAAGMESIGKRWVMGVLVGGVAMLVL